ncbi:MAG TPA: exodeoxyribonuclease VII large subunit, partial [Blastocatellia bacterium]|nr:exodeoxyribonuclease VII large subunit [Blastocatellia bacterium]
LVTSVLTEALGHSETQISIAGELIDIKDLRNRGGIVYFSLQEGRHRFRCQVPVELADELGDYLKNGTVLECYGSLAIGRPGSTPRVELFVERIEVIEGQASPRALLLQELQQKGWMDDKVALPALPYRIGLVTSPESEAVTDFLSVVEAVDNMEIEVVEVSLSSEKSVVDGLRLADRSRYDVMVLTRGGGEGLGIFDSFEVAEAIHNARTPIVSAVGHQRDWTIADMIADARAATPSEAARLVAAGHLTAAQRGEAVVEPLAGTNVWRIVAMMLALLLAIALLAILFRK